MTEKCLECGTPMDEVPLVECMTHRAAAKLDQLEEPRRCVASGKQVILDGEHFADARSPEAAAVIADCIEFAGQPGQLWLDPAAAERVESYLA